MGHSPGAEDGARRARASGWACLGPTVEVCGAPGGRADGTRLSSHPHPCSWVLPCGERPGFRRKERVGATAGAVRRHGVRTHEGIEEGAACVTERRGRA